jgi:hypothetical protein
MSSVGLGTKIYCDGEDQQQFSSQSVSHLTVINPIVRISGQGETMRRECKRLKLDRGQAYEGSSDHLSFRMDKIM